MEKGVNMKRWLIQSIKVEKSSPLARGETSDAENCTAAVCLSSTRVLNLSGNILENAFVLFRPLNVAALNERLHAHFDRLRLGRKSSGKHPEGLLEELVVVNLPVGLHDLDHGSLDRISSVVLNLALHLLRVRLLLRLRVENLDLVPVHVALEGNVHRHHVLC